ncbi:MAG: chaperone modulator CbpM [Alphaproteobacteria bacterium]
MKLSEAQVVRTLGTVSRSELRVWVREGWIAPASGDGGPLFDETDVARIRLVCQLRDDLELNEESVSVVLSLMDQLYGLRRELKALAQAVDRQPEDVRGRIHSAYRTLASRRRP